MALDISTHMSTSYLDIHIRMHLNRHIIFNVQLLAVPVYVRHTAAVILDTAPKALDFLCPSWKYSIVSVSAYGKRKMAVRISGVATLLQNVAKPGFVHICCSAHQLDIVFQSAYSKLGDESFYTQITALVLYLWGQRNFVSMI